MPARPARKATGKPVNITMHNRLDRFVWWLSLETLRKLSAFLSYSTLFLIFSNAIFFGGNREWLVGVTSLMAFCVLLFLLIGRSAEQKFYCCRTAVMQFSALLVLGVVGWIAFSYIFPEFIGFSNRISFLLAGHDGYSGPIDAYVGYPLPLVQKIFICATLVIFGCFLAQRKKAQRRWVRAVLGFQLLIALYSAINQFMGNEFLLWFEREINALSQTGTFVNRNSYATFVGLGLLLALKEMIETYHRMMRDRGNLSHWMANMVFYLLIFLVLMYVLTGTQSRAGIIGFLFGAVVFLLLRKGADKKDGVEIVYYIVVAGLAILVYVSSFSHLEGLDVRLGRADDEFYGSRYLIYETIWSAITINPWAGYGVGSFEQLFRAIQPQELAFLTFDKAHNVFLELFFELGVPVALCLIAAVSLLVLQVAQYSGELGRVVVAAWAMVAMQGLVDFSIQIPAVAYLLFGMTGVAFGEGVRKRRRKTVTGHGV